MVLLSTLGLLALKPVNDGLTIYIQKNLDPGPAMAAAQSLQVITGTALCLSLPFSQPDLIACGRRMFPMKLFVPAHGWGADGAGLKAGEPGAYGKFLFSHKAVTSYANDPKLRRNPDIFIASSVKDLWEAKGLVPKGFFPIVISMDTDNPERIKRRTFINDYFTALLNPPEMDVAAAAKHAGLTTPWVLTDAAAAERLVTCLLYGSLFRFMPPSNILDAVHEWADRAKACAVGKCAPGTDGPQVWGLFEKIVGSVTQAEVGKEFLKAASQYGFDDPEARLREMLLITNFAGVGGTSDNVGAALYAVSKEPHLRTVFWKDPDAFVREAARLYPGVAGMLTRNNKERSLTLGNGRAVHAEENEEFYIWNAGGNIDPTIFGGPSTSQAYALQFDPSREHLEKMLTFNAELGHILGCNSTVGCPGAARPCPGTRLALKISVEVLKYVLSVSGKEEL